MRLNIHSKNHMHSYTAAAVTDYLLHTARHIIQRQDPQWIWNKFLNNGETKLRFLKTDTILTTFYEISLFFKMS